MSSKSRPHGISRPNKFSRPLAILVVFLITVSIIYLYFVLRFFNNRPTSSSSLSVSAHTSQTFKRENDDHNGLHLVFNTGCNLFQHWQAQALMASALRVNQSGWITRIVSGCDYNDTTEVKAVWTHPRGLSDHMVPMSELNRSVFPRFRLHLTPVFEGAKEFPYLNKPQSLEHWIKHANSPIKNEIIAILDPDFIFLTPLTVKGEGKVLFSGRKKGSHKVSKGHPVAQKYGIGSQWVKYTEQVCGKGSPCTQVTEEEANEHYQVGPPYLLHREDFAAMMPLYTEFMKGYVKLKGPGILSDMYAYAMAAAHLELPHEVFDHFMVSCVACGGEGWNWVDVESHNACTHPFDVPSSSPVFLHYCHNYGNKDLDQPMFHKGHVPPNILDCDQPSIIEPSSTFQQDQTTLSDKRNAWMVCMIIPRVNSALEQYKNTYCDNPDVSKRFRLIHGEKSHSCGDREGKTCWVYADKMEKDFAWPKNNTNYGYVGCFADSASNREFPHSAKGLSTVECSKKAVKAKATYFGMQNGGECYWGNSYGKFGKSQKCDTSCIKGQGKCGGRLANSVYKV